MRQQLVKNALVLWAENIDVSTLEGRKRISQFFTEIKSSKGANYWGGAHFAEVSTDGIFDDSKRSGDRGQYCGLFIAYAGLGIIQQDIGYFCLPSTARMNSSQKWREAGAEKPTSFDPAYVKPEPGDIVTVNTGAGKSYGDHFALVIGHTIGGTFATVEANATGLLADGRHGRGVVKRSRKVSDVKRLYRLEERHFVQQGVC